MGIAKLVEPVHSIVRSWARVSIEFWSILVCRPWTRDSDQRCHDLRGYDQIHLAPTALLRTLGSENVGDTCSSLLHARRRNSTSHLVEPRWRAQSPQS